MTLNAKPERIVLIRHARLVQPCSKSKTFEEVIPKLFDSYDFSLNQLYDGLEYIACEYEKIIEIYNHQIQQLYKFDTSHTYFDCTNFYFEIDKEDAFRRKDPSKENRKEPIVGLGLLLDAKPVYLQKEDTIAGHFLICYLAVLLTKLLQFKILKNNYCSEDLFEFVHDFRVAKISDRKYINLSRGTTFIKEFASLCNLPLTSYFLNEGEIKKMLSHRF